MSFKWRNFVEMNSFQSGDTMRITRREIFLYCLAGSSSTNLFAQSLSPLADSHNHFGLLKNHLSDLSQLKALMEKSGVTLLSWSIVPDFPFQKSFNPEAQTVKQNFEYELARAIKVTQSNQLKIVKTVQDISDSEKGIPSVVLTAEGADFLAGSMDGLKPAIDAGIQHIQLVHYIKNAVGDIQTEGPQYDGLSPFGKSLITKLNTLGVLIDLAHGTEELVDQAIDLSRVPVIWSHSFLSSDHGQWRARLPFSRAIGINVAKRIAKSGGAVGLWALGRSFGGGISGYANEIMNMVDKLGPEHVMFGSDTDGLPNDSVINSFDDLRRVFDELQKKGLDDKTLKAISYGNYARCLKNAFSYKA